MQYPLSIEIVTEILTVIAIIDLCYNMTGSWVDVNSPSQIHSPINSESSKYQRPPYSLAESVQHLGVISYQVEKLLQQQNELDRLSQGSHTNNNNNTTTISHADLDTDDNNRSSTTATSSNNNNNNSLSHSPPSNPKSPPIDIDYLSDSLSLVEAIFDKVIPPNHYTTIPLYYYATMLLCYYATSF